eukprot:gene3799-4195_t
MFADPCADGFGAVDSKKKPRWGKKDSPEKVRYPPLGDPGGISIGAHEDPVVSLASLHPHHRMARAAPSIRYTLRLRRLSCDLVFAAHAVVGSTLPPIVTVPDSVVHPSPPSL